MSEYCRCGYFNFKVVRLEATEYETHRKTVSLIFFYPFFICVQSCKKIVKHKDISDECKKSIVWLYNSLEKKNGLLKVKFENFEKDTQLWTRFAVCAFGRNLSIEEVKKLSFKKA